jgi:uncharacterized membrane protein
MEQWQLSPITDRYFGEGAYLVVAILVLLLLSAWTLSVLFTPLSRTRRCLLALLRILVILTLLVAMLRPTHIFTELQKQSATLVFLMDQSRSMLIEDTTAGDSRWEEMKRTIAAAAPHVQKLREEKNLEIRAYTFDDDIERIELDTLTEQGAAPDGIESAYGESLRDVLQREDGKRLIGLVLMGDGAEQTVGITESNSETVAKQMARLGCPLFAVPFGQRAGTNRVRDVAVESAPEDLAVFVKNRLTLEGTLRVSGYANEDLPVQLILETPEGKEEVVATDRVRVGSDGEQVPFQLTYIPEAAGDYKLLVRAVPQEGEVTTTNNELPAFLTVLSGGLKILYIQGEVRPEQRFLRRALAASPDIDVTLLNLDPRHRKQWPLRNLAQHFKSGAYDVYILGDVDSRAFHPGDSAQNRPADLLKLKEAVLDGAGLLMLGGWHSFRPGGYHHTPLADVIPVEMDAKIDRFVNQNFDESIDRTLHLEGPLQMRPADPWGLRIPLMKIAPAAENMAAWLKLSPLSGANRFRGVKAGAHVLADDGQQHPLLVSGEPGGRVLAFAGDSTWRWVMQGHEDLYRRFWRQVALWLAQKEAPKAENVWVKLDGRRFTPGQRISFHAGAESPSGDPVPNLSISAEVIEPNGTKREVRLAHTKDDFSGIVRNCNAPGSYTITLEAKSGNTTIGSDTAQFFLYAKDRELSGSTSDPAMLETLANHTQEQGGRSLPPEELSEVLLALIEQPMELEQRVRRLATYWDRWYVLALFAGLLCIEWFLRKKWRLV